MNGGVLPKNQVDWFSVWELVFSGLAILILWGLALLLFLSAVAGVFQARGGNVLSLTLPAATLAASGLILLPSAILALMRLAGRPLNSPALGLFPARPTLLVLLFPFILLLGEWVSKQQQIAWLFLPPIHVLAIAIPVIWLAYMGARQLPLGSPQRQWGVLGTGLVLGPLLILILELLALIVVAAIAFLLLSNQPNLMQQLNRLMQQLQSGQVSQEQALQLFAPYLTQPSVLFTALAFVSVIVPLIEEMLKPIGVWFLVGKNITPAGGFGAGVLSGAGYALFESLALTPGGDTWAFLISARAATAVIHILTAGLTGYALALAWRERRYLRLGVAYLTAVALHGLWNGLTLQISFSSLVKMQGAQPVFPFLPRYSTAAVLGLGFLVIGAFTVLVLSNRTLVRSRNRAAIAESE